jgi:uncharacterized protein (TIGR02646 family)
MIRLCQQEIPEKLQKNQHFWTANLLNAVREYGCYSNIPESVKNSTVNKYRDDEIKHAIEKYTKGKCAFCESLIATVDFINIEHFYPKSIHYKFTFKWSNLLPSCRKCNISKDNFDTKKYPFVNPLKDNPENLFYYKELKIEPVNNNLSAENTKNICQLNRDDLLRIRSKMLLNFYSLEDKLKIHNKHYFKLVRNSAKIKSANNLLQSLDNLNSISDYYESYAGFMRYLIINCTTINESIKIINRHNYDLNRINQYKFDW